MLTNASGNNQTYLRVSLTDRCNLACRYCMPDEGFERVPREEILTPDEIGKLVSLFVENGISKVRLTGGEPLIRGGLDLILNILQGIREKATLAITTNGLILSDWIDRLATAGVAKINISLDSLQRERFQRLTGVDGLSPVLRSIEEAASHPGIDCVKVNTVLQRGINDDEIAAFMDLADRLDIDVRFIELMPVKGVPWQFHKAVTKSDILAKHKSLSPIRGGSHENNRGPAEYYQRDGFRGRIGFIASLSQPACESCNRLRLTAKGILLRCLFEDRGLDVKTPLRKGVDRNDLMTAISEFTSRKTTDPNRIVSTDEIRRSSPCLAGVGG